MTPSDILAALKRERLETFIEVALELLDAEDGDHDLEDNGDCELDGTEADQSFTEWSSRGRHNLFGGNYEAPAGNGQANMEDAEADDDREDDDPAEDDDPDDLNGDEGDYSDGDFGACSLYGVDQTQPIGPDNSEVR